MRILLWSDGDRAKSAAAREWFYDMHALLQQQDVDVDLNDLGEKHYDVALIHWGRLDRIYQIQKHSPNAHIGVLNPGYLGFPLEYIGINEGKVNKQDLDLLVSNVDFFVVSSFAWRDMLLQFKRRVYQIVDYVTDLQAKPVKHHQKNEDLIIGYHGNEIHYAQDFFPNGANALKRLAQEHQITLKLVMRNVASQPRIPGVRTIGVEWKLNDFEQHLQSFDIGICPSFSDLRQLSDPFTYIRNPNRAISLLAYGIPSVTSPIFESCNTLTNNETTLFAITEDGWYDSLKSLITQPELRTKIGKAGRQLVERSFSEEVIAADFHFMLKEEMKKTVFPKTGIGSQIL